MSKPSEYSIAEYEDGWFVEKPDPRSPLEDCRFIQVAGPYRSANMAAKMERKLVREAARKERGA